MKKVLTYGLAVLLTGGLTSLSAQTLKHSYTFNDGTATDIQSGADGRLVGGKIVNGKYVASQEGNHIVLPSDQIQINTYSGITLEALITAEGSNATNTMLAYFGATTGSYGNNYLFLSPTNGNNSKAAISCNSTSNPWTVESVAAGNRLEDGEPHHLIAVLSNTHIQLFIDGQQVQSTPLSDRPNNKISNLSNELGYLCKGGYTNDPTWKGEIHEFNIYDGEMAASIASARSILYMSAATLYGTAYGEINFESNVIERIPAVTIAEFYAGLTAGRQANVEILDASGAVLSPSSSAALNANFKVKVTGTTVTEYTLDLIVPNAENKVTAALGAAIDHDENKITGLPKDLTSSQLNSGIKVSSKASFKLLNAGGGQITSPTLSVDATMKIEVTAENGDVRTYSLQVGNLPLTLKQVTNSKRSFYQIEYGKYELQDGVEWYVNAKENVLQGATLNLVSEDVWVYFTNVKPKDFQDKYWNQVFVNGARPTVNQEIRLVQYGNGCVLIGHPSTYKPLTVYADANLAGESKQLDLHTYHKTAELGSLADNIESFILKKGYMATFSANTNGTGASKAFIADTGDVVINTMPTGLVNSTSFIRVFPWRWVNKKGFDGSPSYGDQVGNASWTYSHGGNGHNSTLNTEFVPIRHNPGWPSYQEIYGKENVTHALYYNEPDNPVDDGFSSVEDAIAQYPNLLASGLRMVSPACTDGGVGWLVDFVNECKTRNYRVDVAAIHFYRGGQSTQQFRDFLQDVHNRTGLPVWITEWNNGCNWTCCLPSYEQQGETIEAWTTMLEELPFVERYVLWHGCNPERAYFYSDGTRTPGGEAYFNHPTSLAYSSSDEHDLSPYPANKASDIPVNAVLSWNPLTTNTGRQVYFGETSPPPYLDQLDASAGSINIGILTPGTTYYWRVDELVNGEIVPGEELQFTTSDFSRAQSPFPADSAQEIETSLILSWQSDPEVKELHKVYFGTHPDSLKLEAEFADHITIYNRLVSKGTIDPNTTYYWRVDEQVTLPDGSLYQVEGETWTFSSKTVITNLEKMSNKLILYPNPVNDFVFFKGISETTQVDIYNLLGQKISTHNTSGKLDLSHLDAGVYILKTEHHGSYRIVKQ